MSRRICALLPKDSTAMMERARNSVPQMTGTARRRKKYLRPQIGKKTLIVEKLRIVFLLRMPR